MMKIRGLGTDGGNDEHVDGDDVTRVVLEEDSPEPSAG
jgi:hypothetical protein